MSKFSISCIEQQIAIAPQASSILVYNAPNDFQGITEINEHFKIANDDFAAGQNPPGWFGIGGTSLSSPFWSAIIGLYVSVCT